MSGPSPDPRTDLRCRSCSRLLVQAAILRVPISTAAYGFLRAPSPVDLPGVVAAALASLGRGAVLGPEAPLIALSGGLGGCTGRPTPPRTTAAVAAAGAG
jgi:H+/Cl- antiporter ClcA